ncbi:MAG: bifunctional 5,10-methylene-tetrahydrofolate dehydrogenase/5,10-methylene-tetrahydrofolate cyclohydrolase [Clostridiales bacterium]|nr:bifunctional 5,10-methylene-tetrahydrofolate dehydrogenase/5,10-methylene-tetrahydrofolate cyclohydrolase [Clostridiales bacterium]
MVAVILNGKETSKKYEEEFKNRVEVLKSKLDFLPTLATIIVGEDMASKTYVNMKCRACERIGLGSKVVALPENTTTEELLSVIQNLNNDKSICGILLQHPVPKQINERLCFDAIDISKDVDGVNSMSFGLVSMGEDAYKCATPYGIIRLMKEFNIEMKGKRAVVVGRSAILGKPLAMLLLNEDCTVTICHSKTVNLEEEVRGADIVVGALGKAKFIKSDWIKDGAVVIDAGYNEGNVGDVDVDGCMGRVSAYTPVPGGVGPMTINSLILQTLESAEKLVK